MIGVDANVLARLFVADDGEQQMQARAWFAERSGVARFYVSHVVLAEFFWLLRTTFGYAKPDILNAIEAILNSSDFVVQNREVVTLAMATAARPGVDFKDALIAQFNLHADCDVTITFDRNAAKRIDGMELVT